MGCNDSEQTSSSSSESQSMVPEMGDEERNLVKRLTGLGVRQADALKFVLNQSQQPGGSMLAGLQGGDKALLDQAFSGAESGLQRQADIMGQNLAGTRGLNMSDTPVSEAVLREMLPQFANLQSQKAQQSLGLGLNLGQLNEGRRQFNIQALLNGSQITPSIFGGLANRFQTERFANARTMSSGTGTQSYSPGLMDQVQQGFKIANDGLDLASKLTPKPKG